MFIENCKSAITRVGLAAVLITGIFGVQPAKAETVGFGWVKSGGGQNFDYGTALAADNSGNVYATGFVTNGPGNRDTFVQKWDANGNPIWASFIAGPSNDTSYGITLDGNGNVYVAGSYSATVDFDEDHPGGDLTSAGFTDAFVIKYDNDGNFIWVRSVGGPSDDSGQQVALDASGNVYLTGYYSDTVDLDPGAGISNFTSAGSNDVFVSKFDSNGNFLWAKSIGGTSDDQSFDIAIDQGGDILLTGYFSETADFDPGIGTSTLTSRGEFDIFISKLNSNGNFVWVQSAGGSSFDNGIELALDGSGNIYLAGYFSDAASAGTTTLVGAGSYDIFVSKLDGSGNILWAKGMGGTSHDSAYGIALDDDRNVYLTGEFNGMVDFDPGTSTSNLTSAGAGDIFIDKLDNNGNFIWAKNLGGISGDGGDGIVVDRSGILYLIGSFSDTVDFDPGTGTTNLTSGGSSDVFLGKFAFTPQIYYVKGNAMGAKDGSSWIDAYTDLQSALAAAASGDEVWIAAGTYKPTTSTDRTISFSLKNGVSIYGGFAGIESTRSQRDPAVHVTVLSGDLNGDDTSYTGGTFVDQPTRAENSFHVVSSHDLGNTTILDGFTIKGGNANLDFGTDTARGGGIWNRNGSPTLANIVLTDNISLELGGGMFNDNNSQPSLTKVLFVRNHAERGAGLANIQSSPALLDVTFDANAAGYTGGGMVNLSGSSPILEHVTFDGNSAWIFGGGMSNYDSTPRVSNSGFLHNVAFGWEHPFTAYDHTPPFGGGMFNYNSDAVVVNSTFVSNSTANPSFPIDGGDIGNKESNPTLTHITITGYGDGIMNDSSYPIIRNSIIWGTDDFVAITDVNNSSSIVSDSVIQNGFPGGTNIITADPMLSIPLDDGDATRPIPLLPGSSAIDQANASYCPAIDQRYVARPQGSGCDIGAVEYEPVIHYVKRNASGANNGTSWANAFTDLQSALSAASSGNEIWVAAGTYQPTTGIDRTISFTLKNGVAIYGGFAGTETLRTQRTFTNLPTLSGDIGVENDKSDNSYNVVIGSITNNSAVLDGFTITDGNANSSLNSSTDRGGGMYVDRGSPMISNTTFIDNSARFGGGLCIRGEYNDPLGTKPILTNVTFENNSAIDGGGGMRSEEYSNPILTDVVFKNNAVTRTGGGMENIYYSNPKLINVTFDGNTALAGGGMYNWIGNNPTLTNVTFTGNTAESGGGMVNDQSSPILTNVTFSDNLASRYGGGMSNENSSNPALTNVTFSGNTAEIGGGMYNQFASPALTNVTYSGNTANSGGGIYNISGTPSLTNVTFSGNTVTNDGGGIYNGAASPSFTNVTFDNNTAGIGGGMFNVTGSPALTNVTYSGNTAIAGGGMYNYNEALPSLTNVTFDNNTASLRGGGIFNNYSSNTVIVNSILYGDSGGEIYNETGTATVTYSIVQGGYPGTGNLDLDPLLGPLQDNGSFTQTRALGAGSPAIDTGDDANCPDTDQRGITRPQGSHCDIGAYEAEYRPTISGNVGLAGVTLNYTDGTPKTITSDSNGNYSISVPVGWSGVVTPTKAGYTFTPLDRAYSNLQTDETGQNYVPQALTGGADTTGVFRPSNGALYLKNKNETGFADVQINYGIGGDYPVVGDWDGNGTVTIGIYRNGLFYLRNSNTIGFADVVFPFGAPGDQPVAGDWDGDGVDTIGVYRRGIFFLRNSNDAGAPQMSFALGIPGDVGIAGDWNGDGKDTTGVFRPSNGALYLKNTNVTGFADIQINYGLPGDKPVTGDWNNDGIDTIGVYRNGQFMLRNTNTIGFADWVFDLGVPGDMPIAGNWDGLP